MNLSRQTEKIGLCELKGDVEGWAVNIRGFVPELEVKIADLLTGIGKYLARRQIGRSSKVKTGPDQHFRRAFKPPRPVECLKVIVDDYFFLLNIIKLSQR